MSSPHLIDIPGPNQLTPLANAVLSGNKDIVEIIINAKADVNSGCPLIRRTPLHVSKHKLYEWKFYIHGERTSVINGCYRKKIIEYVGVMELDEEILSNFMNVNEFVGINQDINNKILISEKTIGFKILRSIIQTSKQ